MIKLSRMLVLLVAVMGVSLIAADANADRGGRGGGYRGGYHYHGGGGHHGGNHWSGSFVIGVPWFAGPYPYGYPYSYGYSYPYGFYDPYPRDVVVLQQPQAVTAAPSGPPPAQYWYYCDSAHGYYPYIPSCPEPWRAVPATPPASH